MNIGSKIIEIRKKRNMTQEDFAMRSGLGLRFVRDLEQGKETVRMDKVNIALAMFDMEAVPGRKERGSEYYGDIQKCSGIYPECVCRRTFRDR